MWSRKPALSWLDRLRSSKGIPVTTDLNLEQFLNQNPNSSDSISIPKQIPSKSNPNSTPESESVQESDEESKWFNTMSSVLAELFVMEDKSNKSHQIIQKKSSRKQINPKICVLSSSASVDDGVGGGEVEVGVMSPSSVDNSVVEINEENEKLDLSGCSRLDCVVIDTSSVGWKTENMVIRKGNVWKVREKNSKLKKISMMKKKRKAKKIDDDDDSEDEKKMKKSKKKKMKQKLSLVRSTSISNKADDDQCGVLPFEGSPVDNSQISIKRTHPNLDQAPIKRCKFLSLSANPGKKSSVRHL